MTKPSIGLIINYTKSKLVNVSFSNYEFEGAKSANGVAQNGVQKTHMDDLITLKATICSKATAEPVDEKTHLLQLMTNTSM